VREHQEPRGGGILAAQGFEDLAVLRHDAVIVAAPAPGELPRTAYEALTQILLDDRQEGFDRFVAGGP